MPARRQISAAVLPCASNNVAMVCLFLFLAVHAHALSSQSIVESSKGNSLEKERRFTEEERRGFLRAKLDIRSMKQCQHLRRRKMFSAAMGYIFERTKIGKSLLNSGAQPSKGQIYRPKGNSQLVTTHFVQNLTCHGSKQKNGPSRAQAEAVFFFTVQPSFRASQPDVQPLPSRQRVMYTNDILPDLLILVLNTPDVYQGVLPGVSEIMFGESELSYAPEDDEDVERTSSGSGQEEKAINPREDHTILSQTLKQDRPRCSVAELERRFQDYLDCSISKRSNCDFLITEPCQPNSNINTIHGRRKRSSDEKLYDLQTMFAEKSRFSPEHRLSKEGHFLRLTNTGQWILLSLLSLIVGGIAVLIVQGMLERRRSQQKLKRPRDV